MRRKFVLLAAALASMVLPLTAMERVSLKVWPLVAISPATIRARATIPSNEENRSIEVIAESDTFYRSSRIQLDGQYAPRTTLIEFRHLPDGQYRVRAVLRNSRGQAFMSAESLATIVGPDGSQ